jgi:hypothetical protein
MRWINIKYFRYNSFISRYIYIKQEHPLSHSYSMFWLGGTRNDISCNVACCLNFETIWVQMFVSFLSCHFLFYFFKQTQQNIIYCFRGWRDAIPGHKCRDYIGLSHDLLSIHVSWPYLLLYFSFSPVRYLPSSYYYFFTFVGNNTMLYKCSYIGTLVPLDALASNLMH